MWEINEKKHWFGPINFTPIVSIGWKREKKREKKKPVNFITFTGFRDFLSH